MTTTAQASRMIPAEPAEVWETLTSREAMKAYMTGVDVEMDWRVGGAVAMRGEFHGKPYEDLGEVRSFEPRRRLSYTQTSSAAPDETHLVTIELKSRKAGTRITVVEDNCDGPATDADLLHRAEHDRIWAARLKKLAAEIEL